MNRLLRVIYSLVIFLLILATSRTAGLFTGWLTSPLWALLIAIGLFALWRACAPQPEGDYSAAHASRSTKLAITASLAVTSIIFLWVYKKGIALPSSDPIAIPTLAQFFQQNITPASVVPAGRFAHSYPPGAPALYAYLLFALTPLQGLLVMKIANITAVILIPLGWALFAKRHLGTSIENKYWIPICYFAFLALERTLTFALPFAGKNALLFGIAATPLVAHAVIRACQTRLQWLLTVPILFGLILIQYSLLHLLAVVLAGYLARLLFMRKLDIRFLAKMGAIFALTAILVVTLLHDALHDPRAGTLQFTPLTGIPQIFKIYFAPLSPFFIFEDPVFGSEVMYYRSAAFMLFAVVACILNMDRPDQSLRTTLLANMLGVGLLLSFALNVIPGDISLDYARWIGWPLQAMAYAAVLALFASNCRHPIAAIKTLSMLASAILLCYGIRNLHRDTVVEQRRVKASSASLKQLTSAATFITTKAGSKPCIILADSYVTLDHLSVYMSPTASYLAVVTSCRFGNGSWTDLGDAADRAWDGFPDLGRLQTLMKSNYVVLIGPPARIDPYLVKVSNADARLRWTPAWANSDSTIYIP